ncbi:cysteine--tRNA ligase [Nannocystis exedens]|nr:cysteine--tRNA ligase [Nannocystis exedens]
MSTTPTLLLYDTMSGSKRPLEPIEPGHIGLYLCGPTVYDLSHVGHARSAICADTVVRFLREQDVRVTFVRNVTDIDDKIIKRAQVEGISAGEVAAKYTAAYHEDLDSLGCLRPDVEPRVTGTIPEIIALIETLIARGLAYESAGDVYFRVAAYPAYGALSKRSLDDMQAGARVEVSELKENPLDFALWKAEKPGEPAWPSPWGPGRPGWHIECSAMSKVHLGETFDLHAGGRDLIFPHHENEIAQSQGACGAGTFARHWMHNGFVDFAGEKMSKSLGNFFTIREVTALYPPEAVRWFLLGVHYRSGINFDVEVPCPACARALDTEAQQGSACPACGAALDRERLRAHIRFPGLEEADERVAYVYDTLARARRALAESEDGPENTVSAAVAGMLAAFTAALRDDLNTAAAVAALSEPLREINRLLEAKKKGAAAGRTATLRRFLADFPAVSRMLGLFAADPEAWLLERRARKAARLGLDVDDVERKVALRDEARAKKDWKEADRLRAELSSIGVLVRDGVDRSTWTL